MTYFFLTRLEILQLLVFAVLFLAAVWIVLTMIEYFIEDVLL